MNFRMIFHVMGTLLLVTATAMLFSVLCALFYFGEGDLLALSVSVAVIAGVGFPLWYFFRAEHEASLKDAVFIATFGWIAVSAVSALPFMIYGAIPSFTDGFFEMMSGYTTTGATILTDIEVVPHGLIFWRSETHFIGGMGFLTLALMFMPHGVGGLRIFRAESSPGQAITREKFIPRNRDAMVRLWNIYLGLNLAQVILQCAGGMSVFDSFCHAFGAVSTGGFSPYNKSLGSYDSAYFDWVNVVFMFLGGVNFILFYQLFHRRFKALRIDTELKWYLGFMLFFSVFVSGILWKDGTYGFFDSLRFGFFQVTSLLTTTGFATADYELWPQSAQMFLYAVCFIGGCTGSTASGIKIVHFAIIWKFLVVAVKKAFVQPLTIMSVRINQHNVDQSIVNLAVCYFITNIFIVFGGGCLMVLIDNMDMTTAMSSIIATLMNIGPGFGDIGPTENYAHISVAGKWLLSFAMLVGRLDMFTALVIFYPSFWRQ